MDGWSFGVFRVGAKVEGKYGWVDGWMAWLIPWVECLWRCMYALSWREAGSGFGIGIGIVSFGRVRRAVPINQCTSICEILSTLYGMMS